MPRYPFAHPCQRTRHRAGISYYAHVGRPLRVHGFAQLSFLRFIVAPLLLIGFGLPTTMLRAQATAPADDTAPPPPRTPLAYNELRGRTVEDVRVLGNTQVSTAIILNVVRTRVGDKFDPATVEEDYQRIYTLKKFAN